MSRGPLEWTVQMEPSWPVFIACSMSSAAASRTSPTTMRSGRMRSELRTRSRMVTAPLPSMFAGRDSSRTTWSCWSWSSAASSMVTMRSSEGMNDESTLSVVVLPAPVPPETTTLSRPRTQASRKSAVRSLSEPNLIRSLTVSGSAANLRMVSALPSIASGGTTAFTRLPSGSRASTMGEDSSTRRPMRETILSIVRRRCASSLNLPSTLVELALALEPDVEGAVDHDLGDVGVAQVGLERAVAEDVVGDVLGDPLAVDPGQRPVAGGHHVGEHRADLGLQLGGLEVGVVQLRAELLQELAVHALLEVLEPVLGASRPRGGRRRGAGCGGRADGLPRTERAGVVPCVAAAAGRRCGAARAVARAAAACGRRRTSARELGVGRARRRVARASALRPRRFAALAGLAVSGRAAQRGAR